MDKWVDPRTPVSVTWVGKFKVTIFDQEAYDESLKRYPDDTTVPRDGKSVKLTDLSNDKPAFAKQKPQARYNWITKLEKPLGGVVR